MSSYRPNGELNAQFKNSALAITSLLKAAQNQTQDAYRQGYADALADTLEALQSGLAVHQEGDASMGIASLIDWIESRQQGVNNNDQSDTEEAEEAPSRPSAAPETPQHPSVSSAAAMRSTSPAAPTHHTTASASPQPPASRLPVVTSLPSNADFTFSFPMPSTSQGPAGKKAMRSHGRQAIRREGVNMDTDETHHAPSAKKRKWWEDSLSNGLVQLDLDNAAGNQQRAAEDQALRLFGEVSADARPTKRVSRR